MGVEADLYIDQHWSAGGGIGTSFDFQSWSLHARYQFELQNWRPFLEFGFAQWIMNNEVRSDREASPSQLVRRFLGKNPSEGDVANLLYPSGGLRYLLDDGFSVAANLVYLVNIEDSQGGLYGGMSFQYSY